MKSIPAQIYYFMRQGPGRMNLLTLLRFGVVLGLVITIYSVIFHYIMAYEGQTEHSWLTGFYWTLTVMSTLGFGDITFDSDIGRVFSTVVLMSGIVFLLILFPFTFIEFFYAPWVKAQAAARAPRELPADIEGHVILTRLDPVTRTLIKKLKSYQYPYVLLVSDLNETLNLHDMGYTVVWGDIDDPKTYKKVQVGQARLVVTTANDMINTNVAFTVREISEQVPIMTTANFAASVDILELAGSSHVIQLGEEMGKALARRVTGGDTLAHPIGTFDGLVIAEAAVGHTPLVGKTLRETELRQKYGVTVLGVWERGLYENAGPDTRITAGTVLVMAGSQECIDRYNKLHYHEPERNAPVIIIGGGRVGRATGAALAQRGLDYRIVEQQPERIRDPEKYVLGDAAELSILKEAGIMEAATVVVTTHDDDTNIYLTIYCRRLRPNIQIISRAALERNVATLHRAGADFVMSYASMGANTIISILDRSKVLMVAEGVDVFELHVPKSLVGKSLAEMAVRQETGCNVVALRTGGKLQINPDPHTKLPPDGTLVIIGTTEAEANFLEEFGAKGEGDW
jgi:voltage-gated potassium channel